MTSSLGLPPSVRTIALPAAKNINFMRGHTDLIIIGFIILFWLLLVILVNPIGNFPLNDDWAYAWTVKTLITTGQFRLSDWTAPNLLPQALLGSLFTLPFGFSFIALRFSTLSLGLAGIIVTYGLLREINADRGIALLAALILAVNPLYFPLANSFMTDIPSFTFFTSSIYFIFRGLRRNSRLLLNIGLLLAYIAILNRQSSVIVIPALILAYFFKNGIDTRSIRNAFLLTISTIIVYFSYSQWLTFSGRAPAMYNMQTDRLLGLYSRGIFNVVLTYTHNIAIISIYIGLFLLPILIVLLVAQFKRLPVQQKQVGFLLAVLVVVTVSVLLGANKQMPLTGNILNFTDVGGQSLSGYQSYLEPVSIALIRWSWQLATVLGVIGVALLVNCIIFVVSTQFLHARDVPNIIILMAHSDSDRSWQLLFIVALTMMYLMAIAGLDRSYWFDRYLIVFLPLLMMGASMSITKLREGEISYGAIGAAVVLLLLYGTVTIAGTHDHLASNRVLWRALRYTMEDEKIRPNQIDGGFEFNGWYFGNNLKTCNPAYKRSATRTTVEPNDFKCLYDNENWRYRISYIPEAGFVIEKQYHFRRWLPWRDQTLYVLRRLS